MDSFEAYWAGLSPSDFVEEIQPKPEQLEQTIQELVAEATCLQHPIEGEFAVRIWEWSNRSGVPCSGNAWLRFLWFASHCVEPFYRHMAGFRFASLAPQDTKLRSWRASWGLVNE